MVRCWLFAWRVEKVSVGLEGWLLLRLLWFFLYEGVKEMVHGGGLELKRDPPITTEEVI